MSRPKVKTPVRRYHISGQSVVDLDGKTFYLGPHDSPESIARYAVLIATYQQNGLRLPESFDMEELRKGAGLILGQPAQHAATWTERHFHLRRRVNAAIPRHR